MTRVSALVCLILACASPGYSCFTPIFPGVNRSMVEYARVVVSPSASQMVAGGATSIQNGFHKWNHAPCQGSQPEHWVEPFPIFSSNLGSATITVVREDSLSSSFPGPDQQPAGDSCASIQISMNGVHDDATMRLYSKIRGEDGLLYDCNWDSSERVALMVAHELGHYLGLRESHCTGSIMGNWSISWSQNGNSRVATYLAAGHAIRDYECQKADEVSISPTESDYEEQQCFSDPNCDPYAPCWSTPGCTCPILLDLDQDNFRLASATQPVYFDIDADGAVELITWTRASAKDAFLCWDRNGNGRIDNGSELFGNSTELADDSIAPFGFIALAELDGLSRGGNLDGFVSPEDQIYSSLCVWTDLDHDGETDEFELQGLEEAGILKIGVDWATRSVQDRSGNLFLYHGEAILDIDGKPTKIKTVDVFFVDVEVDKPLSRPDKPRTP